LEAAGLALPIVDFPEYLKDCGRVSHSKYCTYLSVLLVTKVLDIGRRHFDDLGCSLEIMPRPMTDSEPEWSTKLAQNVHFHGGNFRLNASSTDNSTNVVSVSNEQLFVHLQEKARSITDVAERNDIVKRLDKLQKAQGSGGILQRFPC
jgi:hypothetical protein